MKKLIFCLVLVFSMSVNAQKKKKKKEATDTIKTEVINVITTYNPTIADAFKIKMKPRLPKDARGKKKKLSYNIFSAPVASTFIPKSGALKGIELGEKERLFDNYIAAGYGNFNAPFLEVYLHDVKKFEHEFGIYTNYQSANDGVDNAVLDNGFSHIALGGFYTKEDRFFDWKVGLNTFQNRYNWYGLPSNKTFTSNTIQQIDEDIKYTFYEVEGEIIFKNKLVKNVSSKLSLFDDGYNSDEIKFTANSNFERSEERV